MVVVNLREKHRRERTAQVLDAAALLFAQQGYEKTRIEQIAASASVAPATIYNYFSTKPNLLMALVVRHVRASLPERRAMLRDPAPDPLVGINAFECLLAEQALRHLSRECWHVILSAPHLEPGGQAHRTGERLNLLLRKHYIMLLRIYQARGRLKASVDVEALSSLIVDITTCNFARFIATPGMTVSELLDCGRRQLDIILTGLLTPAPRARRRKSLESAPV